MNIELKDSKIYVPVVEAARLCNRSERTIRRWIQKKYVRVRHDEQSRSVRIDLDDIQRMQATKPDTIHPVQDEIEELKLDNQELEQEVDSLKQEVDSLKELVAILLEREDVLEKRMDALMSQQRAGTGNLVLLPRRAPRTTSGAESRGLPDGTQRLAQYAKLHGVTMAEVKGLHVQRLIELTIHQREGDPKRNKQEWWITPEQQVQLIHYWQEHQITYTACGQCQGCMEQMQHSEIS